MVIKEEIENIEKRFERMFNRIYDSCLSANLSIITDTLDELNKHLSHQKIFLLFKNLPSEDNLFDTLLNDNLFKIYQGNYSGLYKMYEFTGDEYYSTGFDLCLKMIIFESNIEQVKNLVTREILLRIRKFIFHLDLRV